MKSFNKEDTHNGGKELVEEINNFRIILEEYNIDMMKLPKYVPKSSGLREQCIEMAKLIICNEELIQEVLKNKKLPYNKVMEQMKVSKKIVIKNEKYIISICLIFTNGFEHLNSFVDISGG